MMKFKYKTQDYQTKAVESIVNVFEGQPYIDNFTYTRDLGKDYTKDVDESEIGYGNANLMLSDEDILQNIQTIQQKNRIASPSTSLTKSLGRCSLDIEMETGTGKTYVYIKTIFELNKRYGWTKFIIVVPSIAIREGVVKTFENTREHFNSIYHKSIEPYVYNSKNLAGLDYISRSADLEVMIINTQAFARSFDKDKAEKLIAKAENEPDKKPKAYSGLVMYSTPEDFFSRRPIDVIAANRPILILDEPQRMGASGSITQNALQQFNPLFSLYYSATHKEHHATMYVLDAFDAFNKKLVKKIEVKGFKLENIHGQSQYIRLVDIISSKTGPKARIEFEKQQKSGPTRVTQVFDEAENDIYVHSGRMDQYKDLIITDIDGAARSIRLSNGIILHEGESIGDDGEERNFRRVQIRETIESHFEKEKRYYKHGIKVLSLFFIDEVANYRIYDDSGIHPGEYARIFEDEYQKVLQKKLSDSSLDGYYISYLKKYCLDASKVHNGYFSQDKKGNFINTKEGKSENAEEDETKAYDLILRDKEKLLSFEEPTRFIFSHSALREGWDNPNIFQICTLKQSSSDISKRQEVGRGLRLCVDQDGNRIDIESYGDDVFNLNLLTVIASESYESFVQGYQDDFNKEVQDRIVQITSSYFEGKNVLVSGKSHKIDSSEADDIYYYLRSNGYIDKNRNITERFKNDFEAGTLEEPEDSIKSLKDGIINLVRAVYDPNVFKSIIKDASKEKVERNSLTQRFYLPEFQKLWNSINYRYSFTVKIDTQEVIKKSVAEINSSLNIQHQKYKLTKGVQKDSLTIENVREKAGFYSANTTSREVEYRDSSSITFDLISNIARKARLTKKTIIEIICGIDKRKFDMFKLNPEAFASQVSDIISHEVRHSMIAHIVYTKHDSTAYPDSIFEEDGIGREKAEAFIGKYHNVQEYIFPDGTSVESVERTFARHLDEEKEIIAFAKLPRKFSIPTPGGNYTPDWAIVFNENENIKHLYFIAETKGSTDPDDLRCNESIKIQCLREFCKTISSPEIECDVVSNYDSLLEQARK